MNIKQINKNLKSNLKNKISINKTSVIKYLMLGLGALVIANVSFINYAVENTIQGGIVLGDATSTAIGKDAIATGRGTTSIGSNTFASGNNMTREQYEEFIRQNNERLKEIERKMQEALAERQDLSNLEREHQDIANKLKAIETYRAQIAEKERLLNEKESVLTREIEVKKGEKVSYRTQIEDLERRLNIIGQLDFSTINDSNKGQAIDLLAQDLKTKMETGVTFLSEYGANGIPVEEYKKAILKQINDERMSRIRNEIYDIDNNIKYEKNLYDEVSNSKIFVSVNSSNNPLFNSIFPKDWSSNGGRESYLDNNGDFIYTTTYYLSPIDRGKKYKLDVPTIKNLTISDLNTHIYDSYWQKHNISFKDMIFNEDNATIFKPNIIKYIKQFQERYDNYTNQIQALDDSDVNLLKRKHLQDKQSHILDDEFKNKVDSKMLEILYAYAMINSMSSTRTYVDNDNQSTPIKVGDIYTDDYIKSSIDKIKIDTHAISAEHKDKLMKLSTEFNEKLETELSKKFQAEIDRLKGLEKDTQDQITVKENEIAGYKTEITNLTNLLNSENPGNANEVVRQINEKKELIANKEKEIANLKSQIVNVSDGENALAHGTDSVATGRASISLGTRNYTNKDYSIAVGTENTVVGEKSIAIGYGHKIIGDRNATLGDPNNIYGDDNFVVGNNVNVGTVGEKANNNLILGSNVTINGGVHDAIVIGNGSKAISGAVSVGSTGAERQIKNVKDATDNQDAVTYKQLKDYVAHNAGAGIDLGDITINNNGNNLIQGLSNTSLKNINTNDPKWKTTAATQGQLIETHTTLNERINLYDNKINENSKRIDIIDKNAKVGTATAIAMANAPTLITDDKKFAISIGSGVYGGEHAHAIAFNGRNEEGNFVYKVTAGLNSNSKFALGLGVGYQFGKTNVAKEKERLKAMVNMQSNEINNLKKEIEILKKAILNK